MRRLAMAGMLVIAAGISCARCGTPCERAMAKRDWADAAAQCETAYLADKRPEPAIATIRALGRQGKDAEVGARAAWLMGTPYASAQHYFRALEAWGKGDVPAATAALELCLPQTQAAGLHDFTARCAKLLAAEQWAASAFGASFTTLQLAMAETAKTDDPILEAKVYGQLADLLGEVGDTAGEARALSLVADRFRATSPGLYSQVRLRQGLLELGRGNPTLAEDAFLEARALAGDAGLASVSRSAEVSLGDLARRAHDWDTGTRHLLAASEIRSSRAYEATTLAFAQAQLLRDQHRCAEADAVAAQAIDAGAVPDWQWQLLSVRGECAEQQGKPEPARQAWAAAAATIDGLRDTLGGAALRPGLIAERRKPYEAVFELSAAAHDDLAAIDAMETIFARGYLEALVEPAPAGAGEELPGSVQRAGSRLDALAAVAQLEQKRPPAAALIAALKSREVIAYLAARGRLYRVRLTGGKIDLQAVGALAAMKEKVDRLAASPDDDSLAAELGAALWPTGPVGAEVLIIADAPLAGVSFAALKVNSAWLVESHTISYAPGLEIAAALAAGTPRGTGVHVLGDPNGDLPGAATEAKETASRLKGMLAVGAQFDRARFDAACSGRMMHLATHSGVGPDGPWLQVHDGVVTAAQVVKRRCGPAVVYLASCASAASARGIASTSLASAFLAAGSQAVVATTRSVDDAVAQRFTRELFADGSALVSPAQQLATAQRALLRAGPRSSWEPFVVFGP